MENWNSLRCDVQVSSSIKDNILIWMWSELKAFFYLLLFVHVIYLLIFLHFNAAVWNKMRFHPSFCVSFRESEECSTAGHTDSVEIKNKRSILYYWNHYDCKQTLSSDIYTTQWWCSQTWWWWNKAENTFLSYSSRVSSFILGIKPTMRTEWWNFREVKYVVS